MKKPLIASSVIFIVFDALGLLSSPVIRLIPVLLDSPNSDIVFYFSLVQFVMVLFYLIPYALFYIGARKDGKRASSNFALVSAAILAVSSILPMILISITYINVQAALGVFDIISLVSLHPVFYILALTLYMKKKSAYSGSLRRHCVF
jgi:hypothetical protein